MPYSIYLGIGNQALEDKENPRILGELTHHNTFPLLGYIPPATE